MKRRKTEIGQRAWNEQSSGTPTRTSFLKEWLYLKETRLCALQAAITVRSSESGMEVTEGSGGIMDGGNSGIQWDQGWRKKFSKHSLVHRSEQGTAT